MTERGILMTPENYGKCADGSKVQTRRLNGLDEINESPNDWALLCHSTDDPDWVFAPKTKKIIKGKGILMGVQCPYGTVGDRLYVKEGLVKTVKRHAAWRRDGLAIYPYHDWEWQKDYLSPLHMPKWAARLWLEITNVRVERLINISNDDAEAEGCKAVESVWEDDKIVKGGLDPYEVYAELWDSIHGEGSWNTDPWVWVISFKPVSP